MQKALISCLHLQRNFSEFEKEYATAGIDPVLPAIAGQQLDADDMRCYIDGMKCVIAGDDEIDASVLEVAKRSGLQAVIKWGIGTDSIDKEAAARMGIPVYNTPGVFSEEVADLAMSHLLLLARGTHLMHNSVVEGGWLKIEGRSLHGLTAGVVGLGSIGLSIARRAHAVGMKVLGSDVIEIDPAILAASHVEQVAFSDLVPRVDAILLACNLTPDNTHLMDANIFASMKPGAYIVNVARGPLVDEHALCHTLKEGHLGGAGLDVFEFEPLPMNSPLRELPNCVFSTHNGSNTREAVARINRMTTDILFDVLGIRKATAFTPNRVA